MSQATTFIYGLCDPRTGFLRYVGKANNPTTRAYRHYSGEKHKSPKTSWILNLRSEGLHPEMFIIEEIPIKEWEDAERFWICYFKSIGCPLTNLSLGGDGLSHMSPQSRAKLSQAKTGLRHSPATRLKMSLAQKGRKHHRTDACIKRHRESMLGRKCKPLHAARIRAALLRRGPHSTETNSKISKALKGRRITWGDKISAGLRRRKQQNKQQSYAHIDHIKRTKDPSHTQPSHPDR